MPTRLRGEWAGAAIFLLIVAATVLLWWQRESASWYGVVAFGVLGIKIGLALWPTPRMDTPPDLRVVALVPVYNEDPAILDQTLRSLLAQTYPIRQIVVVDDCSTDPACHHLAEDWAARTGGLVVAHRQTENLGKRHAMAWGVRHSPHADIYLGVDSDTVLDPTAVEEGLRPFSDPLVMATTGLVTALNRHRNLLTRLIDLRYVNAFLIERGAYSALGSVLCCCGSLAFYQGWVVRKHLDDFVDQQFRGKLQIFGDDRHMTNLCLQYGKVRLAKHAHAQTAVPERFGHYTRQQVRWGKSFFRESLWALKHLELWPWVLSGLEVARWFVLVGMLPVALYATAVHGWDGLVSYLLWVVLAAYAHSALYIAVHQPGQGWVRRWSTFALAPLYGLLVVVILVPLRLWSLGTLNRGSWGTRNRVEVTSRPG